MGKVISILNHKGGVGKTTTTLNLAYFLGQTGKKVLIIDIDPQGSATSAFGIDKSTIPAPWSLARILLKEKASLKAIASTRYENVSIVPATMDLITTAMSMEERGQSLNNSMKVVVDGIKKDYDFVFIDCPPSLGSLNHAALTVSDSVLIPTQCEYFAVEGLMQIVSHIRNVKNTTNPNLKIEGTLLTMYESRNNISVEVLRDIKNTFKYGIYETIIPRNVKLVESAMKRLPIAKHSPTSKGAIAYKKLTQEFLSQNGGTNEK